MKWFSKICQGEGMIAVQEATNLKGPTIKDKDNKTMAEVVREESNCDLRFIIPTKMKALIMSVCCMEQGGQQS